MADETATLTFAIDRSSVRRMDQDGRLHVGLTNISKATVNPYYGREIPNSAALGLDPDTVYQVFRPPHALAAAALSSNNIQLLDDHIIVTPDNPQQDRTVGSTGTDADFDGEYLRNSLVVWHPDSIGRIEREEQKELSCAYRYTPLLKSGTYKGLPYSIEMSDIAFNHVALVKEGRAGPDVMVADSQIGEKPMSKFSVVKGKLAAKFACDAALSTSERVYLMMALDEMEEEVEAEDEDCAEDEAEEEAKAKAADKKAKDEEKAATDKAAKDKRAKDKKAKDEESDPPDTAEDEDEEEKAMDRASVKLAVDAGIAAYARDRDALDQAKLDVAPIVGTVHGLKTAEAVYRFALDSAKVDHKEVKEAAALRAMVALVPKSGDASTQIVMDSAARSSVIDIIPGLARYA